MRCRGCGDPARAARNATRATARDEQARAPVPAPVMDCSPSSDTRNTSACSPEPCPPEPQVKHLTASLQETVKWRLLAALEPVAPLPDHVRTASKGSSAWSAARYSCTRRTAVAPSPTADATRL